MSTTLPSNDDLIAEIRRLLPTAITPALSPSSKGNDLFEGFLFMLVIDAAKSIGANVTYEDAHETPTRTLTLRTSPGRIYTTSPAYPRGVRIRRCRSAGGTRWHLRRGPINRRARV